jgi:hypothetical protein
MQVVVDVWGGEMNLDHLARFMVDINQALKIAEMELNSGYLVNIRPEAAWGSDQNFDSRGSLQ